MVTSYQFLATWLRARCADSERGASLVEYALLVALIALVCFAAVELFGQRTDAALRSGGDAFP